MKRSFSVPVNVKNASLRRVGSTGGVIRVVPATPHQLEAGNSLPNDPAIGRNGMCLVLVLRVLLFSCYCDTIQQQLVCLPHFVLKIRTTEGVTLVPPL